VSYFVGSVLVAPSGERSWGLAGVVDQPLCAVCGSSLAVLNPSVYSAAMRGGLYCTNCALCQQLIKRRLLLAGYWRVVVISRLISYRRLADRTCSGCDE